MEINSNEIKASQSVAKNSLYGFAGEQFSDRSEVSFELARYIAQKNILEELKEMASKTLKENKIVINSPQPVKDSQGHLQRVEGHIEELDLSSVGDILKLQIHMNYLDAKTNVLYNLGDSGLKTQNKLLSTRKS